MTPDALESTYRRLEFVFGAMAVSFTAFVIGTTFAMTRLSSEQAMQMIVVLRISVALSLVGLLVFGFRSHRWTLGESALTIEQWYKVWPPTRKWWISVSFADITAVHRIEKGFHVLIEVESRSESLRVAHLHAPERPAPPVERVQRDPRRYVPALATYASTLVLGGGFLSGPLSLRSRSPSSRS
jgi:hypothetical protein